MASVADLAGIAIVGVDATQDTSVNSDRVLDDHVARTAVVLAVTAAADQLAVVLGIEVLDLDGATAVELNDLIVSVESATTVNEGCAAGLLECESIFADLSPPDIIQCANENVSEKTMLQYYFNLPGSLAVNTLSLRSTDDDVGKSSAVLKNEHSILLTSLLLTLANIG